MNYIAVGCKFSIKQQGGTANKWKTTLTSSVLEVVEESANVTSMVCDGTVEKMERSSFTR